MQNPIVKRANIQLRKHHHSIRVAPDASLVTTISRIKKRAENKASDIYTSLELCVSETRWKNRTYWSTDMKRHNFF